ncbi:MAG: hypothetical protein EHM14_09300 [Methanothrix sp.]|nr:MAG: hypothetical protein EHM14_09300 [Methanothrix sp.]
MRVSLFLIFIFIGLICISHAEVIPEKTSQEYKKDLGETSDGDTMSNGNYGHVSTQVVFPSEAPPMNVSRKIISPMREDAFFEGDVIVVQVAVTSVKKEGLKDVEIWEIPGEGLQIINCSYPVVTSNIGQILDYEKNDKSFLSESDLIIDEALRDLQMRDKSELKRIYNLLSNETKKKVINSSVKQSNESITNLKFDILKEFNNILNNKSNYDLNASYFKVSPSVLDDGLDYWINSPDEVGLYIGLEDYRYIKRRLLEYAFKNETIPNNTTAKTFQAIRPLSFHKDHENLFIGQKGYIYYYVPFLHDRESIIIKYYLKPEKIGLTDLRSIIRSLDHFHEEKNLIKVAQRNPRFEYKVSCDTKDILKNSNINFTYSIKYLGGDKEENRTFPVNVASPKTCDILSVYSLDERKYSPENSKHNRSILLNFTKELTQELTVAAMYTETGSYLSPPRITIEKSSSDFEEDISVVTPVEMVFRMNSETIGVLLLAVSLIVTIIGTLWFGVVQLKQAEKNMKRIEEIVDRTDTLVDTLIRQVTINKFESEKTQSIIEKNTEAITNLTKLIEEKMK